MELDCAMEDNLSDELAGETPLTSMRVHVPVDSINTDDVMNQDILSNDDKVNDDIILHGVIEKHDIKTEIDDIDKRKTNHDTCIARLNGYVIKDYFKIEIDNVMKQDIVTVNDRTNDCVERISSFGGDTEVIFKCENDGDIKSEYDDVIEDICDAEEAIVDDIHDGAVKSEDHSPGDGLPLAAAREETTAAIQEENREPTDKVQMKFDTRDNPDDDNGLVVDNKLSSDIRPYQSDYEIELSNYLKARDTTACYMCNTCNYVTNIKISLVKHLKKHLGEKPFSCKLCGKSFSRKYNLKNHMMVHSGEKPFSCKLCNKSFSRKHYVQKHMMIHSGEKPFSCKLCNKSFSRKHYVQKHMMIHSGEKPFSCKLCNKSFRCKHSLKSHIMMHSGEKPFSCKLCNKSFSRKDTHKAHMKLHSEKKSFSCKLCNMEFIYKYSHTMHMRMIHSAENPFWCNLCDKAFNYKSNFTAHMKTHSSEKPFFCKFCSKVFKSKSCLKKHNIRRINSGEKFSSKICNIDHLIIRREENETKKLTGMRSESKVECRFKDRDQDDMPEIENEIDETFNENLLPSERTVVKIGIDIDSDVSATRDKRQSANVISRPRSNDARDMIRATRIPHSADASGILPLPRRYPYERLTNNKIFQRAREVAHVQCWRYVWAQNGRVYARRDTDTPVQRIRTDSDIEKIFNA